MALTSLIPGRNRTADIRVRHAYEDLFPSLHRELTRLVDRFFDDLDMEPIGTLERMDGDFMPLVNVAENDDEITVTAELPGMGKDDFDVTLAHDTLVLKGEKTEQTQSEDGNCFRAERRFGSFHRRIPLGTEIDEDRVDAQYHDGVLRIRMPKRAAGSGRRKIKVKSE